MAHLLHTKEEWQRKKWDLTRKLFENEPMLSPIPEMIEPGTRSDSFESLPELIVEVVPKRISNDETEEFYQKLEKHYRYLIHSKRKSSKTGTRVFDMEEMEDSIEHSITSDTNNNQDSDNPNDHNNEKTSIVVSLGEREELNLTTEQNLSKIDESDSVASDPLKDTNNSILAEPIERSCRSSSPHNLAGKEDASGNDEDASSPPKPEMMRKHCRSAIRASEIYKFSSENTVTDSPSSISFVASEISMHSRNESQISLQPLMCSTPKSSRSQINRKRKHPCKSWLEIKKTKVTQTSFSDSDENENNEFWTNLFVGKPIIYNLCTCKNHTCV